MRMVPKTFNQMYNYNMKCFYIFKILPQIAAGENGERD